jgi:hypothetical protein
MADVFDNALLLQVEPDDLSHMDNQADLEDLRMLCPDIDCHVPIHVPRGPKSILELNQLAVSHVRTHHHAS